MHSRSLLHWLKNLSEPHLPYSSTAPTHRFDLPCAPAQRRLLLSSQSSSPLTCAPQGSPILKAGIQTCPTHASLSSQAQNGSFAQGSWRPIGIPQSFSVLVPKHFAFAIQSFSLPKHDWPDGIRQIFFSQESSSLQTQYGSVLHRSPAFIGFLHILRPWGPMHDVEETHKDPRRLHDWFSVNLHLRSSHFKPTPHLLEIDSSQEAPTVNGFLQVLWDMLPMQDVPETQNCDDCPRNMQFSPSGILQIFFWHVRCCWQTQNGSWPHRFPCSIGFLQIFRSLLPTQTVPLTQNFLLALSNKQFCPSLIRHMLSFAHSRGDPQRSLFREHRSPGKSCFWHVEPMHELPNSQFWLLCPPNTQSWPTEILHLRLWHFKSFRHTQNGSPHFWPCNFGFLHFLNSFVPTHIVSLIHSWWGCV